MGFSGMRGQVFHVPAHCPGVLDGTAPAHATSDWPDEVTKFVETESVQKREYGHDKSYGFQDVVSGIRRAEVTLDAVSRYQYQALGGYHAGQLMWLELYPFGAGSVDACSGVKISGYFVVRNISLTSDQERGEPVSYTMTLASHGALSGLADGDDEWGGFECDCVTEPGTGTDTAGTYGSGGEL